MIHLMMKTLIRLTEVRRAVWLGLLTKDGLEGKNLKLQLIQLGPTGPGLNGEKFNVQCDAVSQLRSNYKAEHGICSNTVFP